MKYSLDLVVKRINGVEIEEEMLPSIHDGVTINCPYKIGDEIHINTNDMINRLIKDYPEKLKEKLLLENEIFYEKYRLSEATVINTHSFLEMNVIECERYIHQIDLEIKVHRKKPQI